MSTKIEWVTNEDGTKGKTWNPITGCTPISEGCAHCYARRMARRLAGRCGYPEAPREFGVTFHPDKIDQPLRWRKPTTVFVCSMGDLFHDEVSDKMLFHVFEVMTQASQHTFQVLTKRPQRMLKFCQRIIDIDAAPLPRNIWLGVTAENQEQADKRIPVLLDTPAAVRFVSVEPMLGNVDLGEYLDLDHSPQTNFDVNGDPLLDWVIVGGETGPGARPMHPDWARSVRNQCVEAGVPFFFKKFGNGERELDGKIWEQYPEKGL